MENRDTKNDILEASLELFSIQGYEATSLSQIADAVGIRKASVYSHFDSKQKILETLINNILKEYDEHSIFSEANRSSPEFEKRFGDITADGALQLILSHVCYILHDPHIYKTRKMLTVEQFRNPVLKELQTKQNYLNVMDFFTELVNLLIKNGRLACADPEIAAAQLCLPISVWINLCDREPERENKVNGLIERHVRRFFEIYKR